MSIVLTGCAGFIGHRVASLLLDQGHQVYGADRLGDSRPARLQERRLDSLLERPGFGFHRADVSNRHDLREFFERIVQSGPVTPL